MTGSVIDANARYTLSADLANTTTIATITMSTANLGYFPDDDQADLGLGTFYDVQRVPPPAPAFLLLGGLAALAGLKRRRR